MKLRSKERKDLPDEIFGLPRERKFPLHDEEHVRKAIQYFSFCPSQMKNELAKNINARARELGMRVKVGEGSSFYKYSVKEGFSQKEYREFEVDQLVEMGIEEVSNMIDFIERKTHIHTKSLSYHSLYNSNTIEGMRRVEKAIHSFIMQDDIFDEVYHKYVKGDSFINPIQKVNDVFKKCLDLFKGFLKYQNPGRDDTVDGLMDCILEDYFTYMTESMIKRTDVDDIRKRCEEIHELAHNYNVNTFYIIRKLKELQVQTVIEMYMQRQVVQNGVEFDHYQNREEKLLTIIKYLGQCMVHFANGIGTAEYGSGGIIAQTKISGALHTANMNMLFSKEYLKTLKNEMKSQINIILMDWSIIKGSVSWEHSEDDFFMGEYTDIDYEIRSILNYLEGVIRPQNIRLYDRSLMLHLDSTDIMKFKELKKFDRLFVGRDEDRNVVYYGINKNQLFLLGKTIHGELVLIKLFDDCICFKEFNLICDAGEFDRTDRLKYTKIAFNRVDSTQSLTEGFTIDENGDIKFSFNPKKSEMDEYAENHTVLVQNFKAKNYDGMKTNLAFLFALINSIERELYSKKNGLTSERRKELEKARMFAMNDFKTYHKELLKAEPGFNFTDYFEHSDLGKLTISFKRSELLGLKRLFQTIILS